MPPSLLTSDLNSCSKVGVVEPSIILSNVTMSKISILPSGLTSPSCQFQT